MLALIIVIGELEHVWIYKKDHKTGFNGKNSIGIIGKICQKMILSAYWRAPEIKYTIYSPPGSTYRLLRRSGFVAA